MCATEHDSAEQLFEAARRLAADLRAAGDGGSADLLESCIRPWDTTTEVWAARREPNGCAHGRGCVATAMIARLLELLIEIEQLLNACGYDDQANWFLERRTLLATEGLPEQRVRSVLTELRGIIAGMGSFSDLSMVPTSLTGLSREEARTRQWDLADELDEEIERMLQSGPGK